jgi:cytochrome c oxidase subunit IV
LFLNKFLNKIRNFKDLERNSLKIHRKSKIFRLGTLYIKFKLNYKLIKFFKFQKYIHQYSIICLYILNIFVPVFTFIHILFESFKRETLRLPRETPQKV